MEEAETDSVKLAAINSILDRAGYKPKDVQVHEIGVKRLEGVDLDKL